MPPSRWRPDEQREFLYHCCLRRRLYPGSKHSQIENRNKFHQNSISIIRQVIAKNLIVFNYKLGAKWNTYLPKSGKKVHLEHQKWFRDSEYVPYQSHTSQVFSSSLHSPGSHEESQPTVCEYVKSNQKCDEIAQTAVGQLQLIFCENCPKCTKTMETQTQFFSNWTRI